MRWLCVLALAGSALADEIARGPMPVRAYEILERAVASHAEPRYRELNARTLELLRHVPWPRFEKLKRVHVYRDEKRFFNAWVARVPDKEQPLVFLTGGLVERTSPPERFVKVEPFAYAEESAELLRVLDEADPKKARTWHFTYFDGPGFPYRRGVFFINHAYAAAVQGREKDASRLVRAALRRNGKAFDRCYQEFAWQAFFQGVSMLQGGEPRSSVLKRWKSAFETYGQSRYREQLEDLVSQLKRQVADESKLDDVADPAKLPVEERVAYHAARLQDTNGHQWAQPGRCQTLRLKEKSRDADALVAIGRPAVPELIKRLRDRRTTRSVGFHRIFASNRTVLRVQDVAADCIQAILDVRFYKRSSTRSYLSNERDKKRDTVIADITSFWQRYGEKAQLETYLARMAEAYLWDRVRLLKRIEKLDPTAVDSGALLKKWAKEEDARHLPRLAQLLADRGDLSLIPEVRRRDRWSQHAIWLFMRYGNAEDFRLIRQRLIEEQRKGGREGSGIFSSLVGGVVHCKRPLNAPLLVELLGRRHTTGSRYVAGASVAFSTADSCIGLLIKITGHDPGYDPAAKPEERWAAIGRWIGWWLREGREAFLAEHPQVKYVYVAEPR